VKINNEIISENIELSTDWKIYKLILFNVVQNAVKYNENKGKIIIDLKLE